MGIAGAIVAALIAVGCYSPHAEDCSYACNAGACPTGLHCVNNFCREDPGTQTSCSDVGTDGGIDSVPSSYPAAVLADEPTAYFRLGEMPGIPALAINEIAIAGDGTYTGAVTLGTPGALTDTSTAATFEPAAPAQCVTVTSSMHYEIGPGDSFSLEAWINIETYSLSTSVHREIVGKLGVVAGNDAGYSLGLLWEPSAMASRIRLRVGDGVEAESEVGALLSLGTWHHVVATVDGTTMGVTFYVNGQFAGSETFSRSSIAVPVAHFTIGCRDESDMLRGGFDGSIDEVALYRKVLTAQQVMTHFANR